MWWNVIIYHNTILTAAICKQVEHIGRTLTIVPNKSLVRQTAKAFDLVGMDVSVYFSEEKDVSATRITTWQSLERIVKDKNKSPVAKQILEDIKRGLIQITVDEYAAQSRCWITIIRSLLCYYIGLHCFKHT